jgi:hypothetical protein
LLAAVGHNLSLAKWKNGLAESPDLIPLPTLSALLPAMFRSKINLYRRHRQLAQPISLR